MSHPKGLVTAVEERRVRFVVDESVYPLDAIYGAAYLFVARCYVWLDRVGDGQVEVVLRTKEDADVAALEAIAGELQNELLNQVLRLRIGAANGRIREFIMAKAFFAVDGPSTIDRLLAELDEEELADDPLEIPVPWEAPGAGDAGA